MWRIQIRGNHQMQNVRRGLEDCGGKLRLRMRILRNQTDGAQRGQREENDSLHPSLATSPQL